MRVAGAPLPLPFIPTKKKTCRREKSEWMRIV